MSHYIRCPQCREETLDVDTLRCDCGHSEPAPTPEREDCDVCHGTRRVPVPADGFHSVFAPARFEECSACEEAP